MYCNSFTGTLSALISPKLETVDLHHNFFTGKLPGFLHCASALIYVSLANNQLTGTVPASWKALSKLETVGLAYNKLSGRIDWLITKDVLPALIVCFIRDNIFTGTIPGKLPLNLSVFDADSNKFSAIDPAICTSPVPAFENAGGCASDWPNQPFKTCCFGSITCNSTSSLPSCVIKNCGVNCVALEELSAWQDLYDATNGPFWSECSDARSDPCSCSYRDHSGYIEGVGCTDGHITYLQLYGNNLFGTIPSSLANLSNLTTLYLYGNQLTGLLPPLPFAQYTDNGYGDGCFLDDPSDCKEPDCNHFKCPLPAGHKQCKYNGYRGVRCK
jgi:Leucine-rich repeat (LRR) protein